MKLSAIALASIAAVALLGGCASYEPVAWSDRPANVERIETGVVERIELLREGQSSPTALGAIAGGSRKPKSARGSCASTTASAWSIPK
jgi:hypothetical protein